MPSTDDRKGTERDHGGLPWEAEAVAREADGTGESPWTHGNAIREVRATKTTKES